MPSCIRPYTPWNILNMPAGIVPISKVTEQDDKDMESLPNNDLVSFLLKKKKPKVHVKKHNMACGGSDMSSL